MSMGLPFDRFLDSFSKQINMLDREYFDRAGFNIASLPKALASRVTACKEGAPFWQVELFEQSGSEDFNAPTQGQYSLSDDYRDVLFHLLKNRFLTVIFSNLQNPEVRWSYKV